MTTRSLAALFAAAALAAPEGARAAASQYVPGEILVRYRAETPQTHRAASAAVRGHLAVTDLDDGWSHVRIKQDQPVEEAVAAYASDPDVEEAQPNFVYWATAVPNDPMYGQQWALENSGQIISTAALQPPKTSYYSANTSNPGIAGDDIDAERAWNITTDCSDVVVAVLDSGVKHDHEDLAANMWTLAAYPNHGADFVDGDNDPMDENGHGTHVAGTIAAAGNNAKGASGVCWSARIMAVRVLDQFGYGTSASIIAGLNFAVSRGAKIINMSLGGGSTPDPGYASAITNAQAYDVLVVVAAGNGDIHGDGVNNDSPGNAVYPCNFAHANVLCVAALDQKFQRAKFTNYGSSSVDLGAPGTNILATWPGAHSVISEDLSSGWSFSSTSGALNGRWGLDAVLIGTTTVNLLAIPSNYSTTTSNYAPSVNALAYKAFDTTGDVVTVDAFAAVNVSGGDFLRAACKATGGDPFSGGTIVAEDNLGFHTGSSVIDLPFDVSACAGATSSIGFQLQSLPTSATDWGVAIVQLDVTRLAYDTTSYNTINGTSMAAPVVAGVAALLRSYNPAFTFADTIAALKGGGRSVPSLAGVTTSGKVVQALGSLTHVQPPARLRWVEH